MRKKIELVPSLLSSDFSKIEAEIKAVEKAGAKRLHLDVMDGHFVPNITFGPIIINAIRKLTKLHLETHLMIENPAKYLDAFIAAGSDTILFHIEADKRPESIIELLRQKGIRPGIVLNPDTPVDKILTFLPAIDQVLIMTVYPGFGGQKMIKECLEKVEMLNKIRNSRKYELMIEVDGGVNEKTIGDVVKVGTDLIVAGSAIFGKRSPYDNFKILERVIDENINKR
ncbi:MAG: ribulose-phosphate 3-epimerase [Candidatus Marinimicrobia bacterium]|nr:ribulose-phosphate 3-epimerase [Candidatus Neomarinimicrobiota bacterium]HDN58471.1 ribulose-phosphate 3-epimerase [Candidatus Neomarinimicrobiota bacterium]